MLVLVTSTDPSKALSSTYSSSFSDPFAFRTSSYSASVRVASDVFLDVPFASTNNSLRPRPLGIVAESGSASIEVYTRSLPSPSPPTRAIVLSFSFEAW